MVEHTMTTEKFWFKIKQKVYRRYKKQTDTENSVDIVCVSKDFEFVWEIILE